MPRGLSRKVSGALLCAIGVFGCYSIGGVSPFRPIETSAVFQPAAFPVGNWDPQALNAEDAWFEANDGTKLHGWYLDHPDPQGIALFFHGNAGNLTFLADTLTTLRDRHQLAVMSFDYRGYGRSEGKPDESGILMDARAARSWLAGRTSVDEHDIILMGQSLGGAVAVDLASSDDARALVLASTFTSLPDVAKHHLPLLPVRAIMTMRLDSLSKIKNYQGPVLISHGDADEVIPFDHGRALYNAAPGPKRFVSIPGGRHNDPQPEEYRRVLDEFLSTISLTRRDTSRELESKDFDQRSF